MVAPKCIKREHFLYKLRRCILHFTKFDVQWMKREMGTELSLHTSDRPMHWNLNWKSIENNNIKKIYYKGFNRYFNTELWVSKHCCSGVPAGLNADQRSTSRCLPSACYYFFNKTFSLLLLNTHFRTSIKQGRESPFSPQYLRQYPPVVLLCQPWDACIANIMLPFFWIRQKWRISWFMSLSSFNSDDMTK